VKLSFRPTFDTQDASLPASDRWRAAWLDGRGIGWMSARTSSYSPW